MTYVCVCERGVGGGTGDVHCQHLGEPAFPLLSITGNRNSQACFTSIKERARMRTRRSTPPAAGELMGDPTLLVKRQEEVKRDLKTVVRNTLEMMHSTINLLHRLII